MVSPNILYACGFIMVVLGFVLPFLMIIKIIEPTFFLCFLAYTISFGGVVMGIVGTAFYSRLHQQ